MPTLKFYDLKKKSSFETNKYVFESKSTSKGMRYFAIATAPSGIKSYRIVSKDFYNQNK